MLSALSAVCQQRMRDTRGVSWMCIYKRSVLGSVLVLYEIPVVLSVLLL